ncbi:Protein CBG27157 [Caenorhabditis briggsae]|uniref:Protein CBG27157 n=1 Tax=Caenorhabditis briggsae TaxID=6238 RepID=B6IL66_CAEBR|nr:Protein CBG27157 [Caenorhabditis briggsae]CAS00619.1 Protein CBG27157 [Caenorhabditis briggsae]
MTHFFLAKADCLRYNLLRYDPFSVSRYTAIVSSSNICIAPRSVSSHRVRMRASFVFVLPNANYHRRMSLNFAPVSWCHPGDSCV